MSSIDDLLDDNNNKKRKLITLGKCSRFNLYILGSSAFKFLSLFILGDKGKNIGLFGFSPILYNYNSMQSLYTYLGYIIIGIIWIFVYKKRKKKLKMTSSSFIHNNQMFPKSTKKTKFLFVLVCFFFIVYTETENLLYSLGFQLLNYWTFETIFSILLMKKYFVFNFYIHHKCSLIFIISSCSACLLVASFLPNSTTEGFNCYQVIKQKYGNYFYCFLIIIFFVFLSFTYSFSRTVLKVIMQGKFVSVNIVIICIGFTGVVIGLIYAFVLYYLKFEYNIIDYFIEFKESKRDYKFYLEIFLVNPLFILTKYFQLYFEIQTIFYLNPIYGLLINNICFGVQKFINFALYNFEGVLNFIFSELSEILAIFGYIFYLEILELNFCGLSDNIKKSITLKGEDEFTRTNTTLEKIKEKEKDDEKKLFEMSSKNSEEEENSDDEGD